MRPMSLHVPPSAAGAESGYLATVLALEPAEKVKLLADTEWLGPLDFYGEAHRMVYTAIRRMEQAGLLPDVESLARYVADTADLKVGRAVIDELASGATSAENATEFARALRGLGKVRAAHRLAAQVAEQVARFDIDNSFAIGDWLESIPARFERLVIDDSGDNSEFDDAIELAVAGAERLDSDEEPSGYVPTGIRAIDDAYTGFGVGIVNVVSAETGVGKTTLCLQAARNAAARGEDSLFFSFEDSNMLGVARLAEQHGSISARKFTTARKSDMSAGDWARVQNAIRAMSQGPGRILFARNCRSYIDVIVARIRLAKHRCPNLRLVVIDYLVFVRVSRMQHMSDEAITEIMVQLSDAAKRYEVCVVLIAHYNRKHATSDDGKPQLAWLKGSSSIEYVAKQIWMLWRPELHGVQEVQFPGEQYPRDMQGKTIVCATKVSNRDKDVPPMVETEFNHVTRCYRQE